MEIVKRCLPQNNIFNSVTVILSLLTHFHFVSVLSHYIPILFLSHYLNFHVFSLFSVLPFGIGLHDYLTFRDR